MNKLYLDTASLIENVHRGLVRLEQSNADDLLRVEKEVQHLLQTINSNCDRLDILANKDIPAKRAAARTQVEQLRYDCRHYHASLQKIMEKFYQQEREKQEREELLSRRFRTNEEHTILIDHHLQHNTKLHDVHRGVDDLLGQGSSVLDNLREQRMTLKGAQKRILDIANTLGLSNTVMRLIEKRTYQDKFILFGGMFVTCLIMFLFIRYFWSI